MNHFTDKHSGIRYSTKAIDSRLRSAKKLLLSKQKYENGSNFCEKCLSLYNEKGTIPPDDLNHKTLTCSHNISVKKCKETGEIEKIWDLDNMEVLCMSCHQEKDGLKIKN